jgi:hypothetical protein
MWRNKFPAQLLSPNLIEFCEPLSTSAPIHARPYCCYVRTVIFYEYPYRVVDGCYAQHDKIDTAWDLLGTRWTDSPDLGWSALAPWVMHDGQVYELIHGWVELRNGHWVHPWNARRVPNDDFRLVKYRELEGRLNNLFALEKHSTTDLPEFLRANDLLEFYHDGAQFILVTQDGLVIEYEAKFFPHGLRIDWVSLSLTDLVLYNRASVNRKADALRDALQALVNRWGAEERVEIPG